MSVQALGGWRACQALVRLRLLCVGMACWACTFFTASPAQAQVWARVDERGVAHFSAEKIDDRYELFYAGGTAGWPEPRDPASVLGHADAPHAPGPWVGVRAGGLIQDRQDPWRAEQSGWETPALVGTTWPNTGAVVAPGHVLAFFDISPAYKAVRHHIREAARAHGLDAPLLQAVIAAESGFDAQAVSPRGAVGLMQIMPATALAHGLQPRAGRSVQALLADPRTNISTGARVLSRLMAQFSAHPRSCRGQGAGQVEPPAPVGTVRCARLLSLVLAGYNAGEGAVRRAGMQVPNYPETQRYVHTVTQLYQFLQPPVSLRAVAQWPTQP